MKVSCAGYSAPAGAPAHTNGQGCRARRRRRDLSTRHSQKRIVLIHIIQVFLHPLPTRFHPPVLRDAPLSLLGALTHHYEELVAHVRRRFGDAGFAREVVHDVCLQVMEKPPATPVRVPLALLRRISHDLAVDRCRSEDAYRARVEGAAALHDSHSDAPDAARVLDAQRELRWLEEAIAALPPRCQTVFVMHKIHGMPHAEVALRLGISRKAVEKHLHAGMAACRAHLARARAPQWREAA